MLGDDLNAVRWQGKRQKGFHEVWYLTAVDPATGDAFWFRYTIDSPAEGKGDPVVGLWAIQTPKANPKSGLALHDVYKLGKWADKTSDEKGFRIEIAKGYLERSRAVGKVGAGDRTIEWDLKWEPNGIGFEHVSSGLQMLGIAKSAVNSGNLAIAVDGTIKVGKTAIKVSKWAAHQSHTWGSRHADQWAWAHCNAFAEDKDVVFEGLSARVRKLGMLLPPASPLYLRLGKEEHEWSSVATIWSPTSRYGRHKWEFEAEDDTLLVRGMAHARPEQCITVEYHDPDGTPLYCTHATGGDLTLEVYRRTGMRWDLEKKLTASGTACFELADRVRDETNARSLDLVEARIADEEPKPAAAPAPKAPAAATT